MMKKFPKVVPLSLFLSLFLAACSGAGDGAASLEAGSADQQTANVPTVFAENGCIACHSVEAEADQELGPSLAGLATRSAETIAAPDYSGSAETVEAYLREAILAPHLYLVEGYEALMPPTYQASLNQQEVAELVDYLLTLE